MTMKKNTEVAIVEDSHPMAFAPGGASAVALLRENLGGRGLSANDLPRIKVPTGGSTTWEVPLLTGPTAMRTLDCVIVYWNTARAYWQNRDSNGTPPDCSSADGDAGFGWNGVAPTADVLGISYDADGRPSFKHDCSTCPLGGDNAWGTATDAKGNPTRGKACKEMRQLFILLGPENLPYRLSLPPTSIGEAHKFFMRMASAGVAYYGAAVSIALKAVGSGQTAYAVIDPKVLRTFEPDERAHIVGYRSDIMPMLQAVPFEAGDL